LKIIEEKVQKTNKEIQAKILGKNTNDIIK